mgnify:FL=1
MMKRIYSLNLAAYIRMATGLEPDLEIDYKDGNGLVHCVFPEIDVVRYAIEDYKRDESLQRFLHSYAELREQIKFAREEGREH